MEKERGKREKERRERGSEMESLPTRVKKSQHAITSHVASQTHFLYCAGFFFYYYISL